MPSRSSRFMRVLGLIGLAACASCVSSRDETRRDTLFTGSAPPTTTVSAPGTDSSLTLTRRDTLALRLDAFVGHTSGGGSVVLPELAMVAADGRRVGFDPATRRTLSELPGAYYESAPVLDDDDAPPDTSASVSKPTEPVIDVRSLDLPVKVGEAYTLVVAAEGAGAFDLNVGLSGRRGDGSVPIKSLGWRDARFAVRRGEVRRLVVRVGDGTLEVRPDTSDR